MRRAGFAEIFRASLQQERLGSANFKLPIFNAQFSIVGRTQHDVFPRTTGAHSLKIAN
jgi:hypothetical protein